MIRRYLPERASRPLIALFTQGTAPDRIALTVALGICLGVTPVLGSTTLLCAVAAVVFQLNLPAIQAVNYLVYPLQIALLIPFIRLGERLFGTAPLSLTTRGIVELIRGDMIHAIDSLWIATAHALAAWSILAAAGTTVLYFALTPVLRMAARRIALRTGVSP